MWGQVNRYWICTNHTEHHLKCMVKSMSAPARRTAFARSSSASATPLSQAFLSGSWLECPSPIARLALQTSPCHEPERRECSLAGALADGRCWPLGSAALPRGAEFTQGSSMAVGGRVSRFAQCAVQAYRCCALIISSLPDASWSVLSMLVFSRQFGFGFCLVPARRRMQRCRSAGCVLIRPSIRGW